MPAKGLPMVSSVGMVPAVAASVIASLIGAASLSDFILLVKIKNPLAKKTIATMIAMSSRNTRLRIISIYYTPKKFC